jgi:hypothetical protein
MNDPINPVRAVLGDRRAKERRSAERRKAKREAETAIANLPAPLRTPAPAKARDAVEGDCAFEAQLLGQDGRKRGLKGGPQTLEQARSAYLEAEWSGPSDRRTQTGRVRQTDI